jgi:hypothetical protein
MVPAKKQNVTHLFWANAVEHQATFGIVYDIPSSQQARQPHAWHLKDDVFTVVALCDLGGDPLAAWYPEFISACAWFGLLPCLPTDLLPKAADQIGLPPA